MAEAQVEHNPDALTPGELAYMQGGDVAGLVKEGLQVEQPAPAPPPAPVADPAVAGTEQAAKPAEAAPETAASAAEHEDEEAQPEIDQKTGRPKSRGQWVSKKALDAERQERKRIADELGATKEQWARLEERFKVFQEAITTPQEQAAPAEEPLPDPEQDIFGFLKKFAPRVEQQFAELRGQVGQVNQMTAEQREQAQIVDTYRQDAARFAQEQADFGDAYKFLMQSRDAELSAAGYADPQERMQLIQADEQAIVRRSLGMRNSPAATVYALAKARGYAPKANGAPNGTGAAAPAPAGQPAAVAAPAPAPAAVATTPSVVDEINRVKAGQEASLSLSNVGGNRPNNLSITDLIAMPEHEFAAFARKNPHLLEAMAGK